MDVILGVVLDRSGSMQNIWSDMVGGLETFVNEQKEVDGKAWLSLAAFDTHYEVVHDLEPVQDIEVVVPNNIKPRGATALIDSVVKTIKNIEGVQKFNSFAPKNVVITIITDGMENASREHTTAEMTRLIEKKQGDGWEFVFLGANQDAFATASAYKINPNHSLTYDATSDGVLRGTKVWNAAVSNYRVAGTSDSLNTVDVSSSSK